MSTKLLHGQPVKPPPLRQRPSVKNQAKALARDSQQAATCRSGSSRKTLSHAVTLHNHKRAERMRPALCQTALKFKTRENESLSFIQRKSTFFFSSVYRRAK